MYCYEDESLEIEILHTELRKVVDDSEDLLDGTSQAHAAQAAPSALPLVVCFGLIGAIVLLTIFAGPVTRYADATAEQLFTPTAYIETVLGGGQK